MGGQKILVLLVSDHGVEVDVHDVIHVGGVVGGGGELCIRTFGNGTGPFGQMVLGRIVGLDAEEDPADLQLGLGEHSEILGLQLGRGGLVIDVPQGHPPAAVAQDSAHKKQLEGGCHGRPAQPLTLHQRFVRDQLFAQQDGQDHWQGHHQHREPVDQDL